MKQIKFTKMCGSGNDFIIIDNRKKEFSIKNLKSFVTKICSRRFSVGADGVIFIEKSSRADFKWRFFNSDGSVAEMCGNGGRCAARYASERGFAGKSMSFETLAGGMRAPVSGRRVKLQMT